VMRQTDPYPMIEAVGSGSGRRLREGHQGHCVKNTEGGSSMLDKHIGHQWVLWLH
jgi:hypothetical protein